MPVEQRQIGRCSSMMVWEIPMISGMPVLAAGVTLREVSALEKTYIHVHTWLKRGICSEGFVARDL